MDLLIEKHYDKTYEECLSLCCANPDCKAIDQRQSDGYNCALSSVTRYEVGTDYTTTSCGVNEWNYYEVKRQIVTTTTTEAPAQTEDTPALQTDEASTSETEDNTANMVTCPYPPMEILEPCRCLIDDQIRQVTSRTVCGFDFSISSSGFISSAVSRGWRGSCWVDSPQPSLVPAKYTSWKSTSMASRGS